MPEADDIDRIARLERRLERERKARQAAEAVSERGMRELYQKQKALEESEERFRTLFENAPIGIYRSSPDGRILMANPALVAMLGFDTVDALMARNLQTHGFVSEDSRGHFQLLIAQTGEVVGLESEWVKQDGQTIHVRENARVFYDEDGQIAYYEGTVEDISEHKQAEQLRLERDAAEAANRSKSAFLANMSHELRTPLNSVVAMSDILLEKYFGDLTEQQEDYVRDIRESGGHLLSLINDILDLSKVEAGHSPLELSQVDLKGLLENSLKIIRERAHNHAIELTLDLEEHLPDVVADERKLKQVVFNLLSNAVKFTPDGGQVGLEAVTKDTGVEICVWDTGIGIAQEDQDRVFGEFVQVEDSMARKYEGTGLGLALVKRFVLQHGGKVWLESEKDKGSRFYFFLPYKPSEEITVRAEEQENG